MTNITHNALSDVEVQTTNSPHRVPHHRASVGGEQSLINTPYTRDPNVPIQCPPEEQSRRNSNISSYQPPNKRSVSSTESRISYSVSLQESKRHYVHNNRS